MEEFKIFKINGTIILEKDNNGVAISQTLDDDIWFSTSKDEFSFKLKLSSRDYEEWQTYLVFENLMKSLIGRYILNDDYQNEYSMLPKDFIDLENKTIIWHSDGEIDNVLKLEYDEKTIKISISKCKKIKSNESNVIRVRTSGSNYEYYYKEFIQFYNQLVALEKRLNPQHLNKQEETGTTLVKKKSTF